MTSNPTHTRSTTPAPTTPATTSAAPPPPSRSSGDRPAPVEVVVAAATILGPLLMLGSSVAWLADADEARAILIMWAAIGLGLTIVGFSQRLATALPRMAAVVLGIGIIGMAAGAAYAAEAAIVDHFGIDRLNEQNTVATVLVLQLPGLLFPLSFVVAAIASWRAGLLAPLHAGLLAVGALMFPASRIPEVAGLGVAADVVLCVALVPLGIALLTGRSRPATRR